MRTILSRLRRLIVDRRGQDLVEYALLVGLFALVAGATLPEIQKDLSKIYKKMSAVVKKAAKQKRPTLTASPSPTQQLY